MKQGHVVQSSSTQQQLMASASAGSPILWSITADVARQPPPLFADHHTQQLLLLGGDDNNDSKMEKKWEQQQFLNQTSNTHLSTFHQLSSTNTYYMLPFAPDPDPDNNKCNSSNVHVTSRVAKKPRTTQQSSASTLKASRKEKLGDRIAALHQIVSPFGKTDTATVLLEATGYIKFLESQIESQTQPYMASTGSKSSRSQQQQHPVLHKDICDEEEAKDLRSRGLCLVPISCTLHVGNDNNGVDYWAPAFGANLG